MPLQFFACFFFKRSIVSSKVLMLISLPCVSSETSNLQPVFLRIYDTKGGSLCQAFPVEIVETGNKNHCVTKAMYVLQRKLRKD